MAYSMTLLSWSVIEYSQKYKAIGEYDHIRDLIKWGTDYLLKTFNSSATTIDKIYSQVDELLKQRDTIHSLFTTVRTVVNASGNASDHSKYSNEEVRSESPAENGSVDGKDKSHKKKWFTLNLNRSDKKA